MPPEADRERLPDRLAAGDAAAFAELFQQYADSLARFAFHYVGSRAEAEAVVQVVFEEVWVRREEPGVWGDPKAVLYDLTRDHALRLRERAPGADFRPPYVSPVLTELGPIVPSGPDCFAALGEVGALIQRAIETLDPREREALKLRGLERSDREIAEAVGIEPAAVAGLLERAVANLVQALPRSVG